MTVCKTCKQDKDDSDFYYVTKFTECECKECKNKERLAKSNRKHRPVAKDKVNNKVCNECKEEKPKTEFYFVERSNRYRSKCKKCNSEPKEAIEVKSYACHICGLESRLNVLLARHREKHHSEISKEQYKEDLLAHNGRPPKICSICGLKTTIPKGEYEYPKYHKECYIKEKLQGENNPNYKNAKIEVECTLCKKKITKQKSSFNKLPFCSISCSRKYYTMPENKTEALIQVDKNKSEIAKKVNKDPEIRKKIAKGQAEAFKNGWSKLEKSIYDEIVKTYPNAQHSVSVDYYTVDIKIENTIVEVQGDYWHSLPKQKIRDEAKRKFLEGKGYKMVYIWEKDWHAEEDKEKLIKEKLSNI